MRRRPTVDPFRMRTSELRFIIAAAAALSLTGAPVPPPSVTGFDKAVKPILAGTCKGCHNDRLASGGLNLVSFLSLASLTEQRDEWGAILEKVRSGEMPPKGISKPPQGQIDILVRYVEGEFERADRAVKPDPGNVVARRLNRYEYANTIRDLLGVEFRADKDFPTDDSSYGFDNISSALTISPVLTERYLAAAEKIAARAIGADPVGKARTFEIANRSLQRADGGTADAEYPLDSDGDYMVTLHLRGERPADAPPVKFIDFYVDRKLVGSGLIGGSKPVELRMFLTSGQHSFRARFQNDEYSRALVRPAATNDKKNLFVDRMAFSGPLAPLEERASRKKVLICDPKTGPACVDRIVGTLANRAYRRSVTKAEVAGLVKFVALGESKGLSVEQGIQLALEAILVSPDFLFRIEADSPGVHRVSDVELASRLSYFLWNSMPDGELLLVAEARKLHTPAVLDAQLKRMLADPRSASLADNFAGQWLEFRNLDVVTPDTRKYTTWGPDLREAMKTETRMFFEYILRENRPVSDFLNAKYTFLNDVMAKHYGIDGVTGSDFRKVDLATDQRGGLLGQASVLTVSSYPTRTSVVLRGKYVLENILGTPPPPPPPDVPALDETLIGKSASLRQQMESHRSNPLCASCHSRMDVLGFGLENYDGVGKWRTTDGSFPVDASGTLPNGKSFKTPGEMRTVLLAQLPQFAHCLTEKMLTYSLGRGLEPYDRRTVSEIEKALAASDYRFQTLIFEIARSLPFQMRRAEIPRKELTSATKELAQK